MTQTYICNVHSPRLQANGVEPLPLTNWDEIFRADQAQRMAERQRKDRGSSVSNPNPNVNNAKPDEVQALPIPSMKFGPRN